MPSSVESIFAAAGLESRGAVSWGEQIPAPHSGPTTGVYVVACPDDVDETDGGLRICPLSMDALDELLEVRPELLLDGARPTARALGDRLSAFWLAAEPIVYIGLAGPRAKRPSEGELAKRVAEYYKTKLGARSPHAGGWFLKTLSVLEDLVVHYAYCDQVDRTEQAILKGFALGVPLDAKEKLHDAERVMPFGNLEHPPGVRKRHGITGAKAPARARRRDDPVPIPPAASEPAPTRVASPHRVSPDAALTQKLRAGDIRSGIIRVPRAAKGFFPETKGRRTGGATRGDDRHAQPGSANRPGS